MQVTCFFKIPKLPQISKCKRIRKDSPPYSPPASAASLREASEKMTSVQEDIASHCHDCPDAVLLGPNFQRRRRMWPQNYGWFCRVKPNRASKNLSQSTRKRMYCEQIVLIGFEGSVSFELVASVSILPILTYRL